MTGGRTASTGYLAARDYNAVIYLGDSYQCSIRNLRMENGGAPAAGVSYGLYVYGCGNVAVKECAVVNTSSNAAVFGITVDTTYNAKVTDCGVSCCGVSAGKTYGVYFTGTRNSGVSGCVFGHVAAPGGGGFAFWLTSAFACSYTRNDFNAWLSVSGNYTVTTDGSVVDGFGDSIFTIVSYTNAGSRSAAGFNVY
jgi:hypothetical protein